MLHVAAERCLREALLARYPHSSGDYISVATAGAFDLYADLRRLPFRSDWFGLVWASHVLEHIAEVHEAIREIARVLRPGAIAVLDVPLNTTQKTARVTPTARNSCHRWAPGNDWFALYEQAGLRVVKSSAGLAFCCKDGAPSP